MNLPSIFGIALCLMAVAWQSSEAAESGWSGDSLTPPEPVASPVEEEVNQPDSTTRSTDQDDSSPTSGADQDIQPGTVAPVESIDAVQDEQPSEQTTAEESVETQDGVRALEQGDIERAVEIWQGLAEHGDPQAQLHLGLLHAEGEHVARNLYEGLRWIEMAAGQGLAQARDHLGYAYYTGEGVSQNEIVALAFFMLAAEQGHEDAVRYRDKGLETLSEPDISRARDIAALEGVALEHRLAGDIGAVTYLLEMPDFESRDRDRAFFLADANSGCRVLAPLSSHHDRIDYYGDCKDALAHGWGKAVISYGANDYYPINLVGYFRSGVFLGAFPFLSDIRVLHRSDFLLEVPGGTTEVWSHFNMTDFLDVRQCDWQAELYVIAPSDVSALDEDRVKELVVEAGEQYAQVCPTVRKVDVRVLPENYRLGDGINNETGFAPVLASAVVDGFYEGSLTLRQYRNDEAKEAERLRRKKDQELSIERGTQLAASRDHFDVRGVTLWVTPDEVRSLLDDQVSEWGREWTPQIIYPFTGRDLTVKLVDGASFEFDFTSPVSGARLHTLVYSQELRSGPRVADLVESLEEKYGEPDALNNSTNVRRATYYMRSAVEPNLAYGPLGAFARIVVKAEDGIAYRFSIAFVDGSLESHDDAAAAQARRDEEQRKYEESRSDEPEF